MKKTFTPNYLNRYELKCVENKPITFLYPQKQTIDFLMQFARSYHVESRLPKQISGMVLN
jgi:hypothetical protein